MIYMTSEEWNKIDNLIELRHWYDLAEDGFEIRRFE